MPPRCGDRGQRVWLQALPSAVRGTLEPPPPSRPQCYYMGIGDKELGTAGGVKREVSGSLSRGINAKRLCTRMKKQDAQMCELRYEKKVDVKNTDLSKLRVKELRKICDDEGIPTKGAPGGVFVALVRWRPRALNAHLPRAQASTRRASSSRPSRTSSASRTRCRRSVRLELWGCVAGRAPDRRDCRGRPCSGLPRRLMCPS